MAALYERRVARPRRMRRVAGTAPRRPAARHRNARRACRCCSTTSRQRLATVAWGWCTRARPGQPRVHVARAGASSSRL